MKSKTVFLSTLLLLATAVAIVFNAFALSQNTSNEVRSSAAIYRRAEATSTSNPTSCSGCSIVQQHPTATPEPTITPQPTATPNLPPPPTECSVAPKQFNQLINVRKEPSTSADILGSLDPAWYQLVLGIAPTEADGETWYKIELKDGRQGWVASRLVISNRDDCFAPPAPSCDSVISSIAEETLPIYLTDCSLQATAISNEDPSDFIPTFVPTLNPNCSLNVIEQINQVAAEVQAVSDINLLKAKESCEPTRPIEGALGVFLAGSPDGTQTTLFVIRSDEKVEAVSVDTVPGEISYPAISPDGKKIAYINNTSSDSSLVIITLDGTSAPIVPLQSSPERSIASYPLTWSLDGKLVLTTVLENGQQKVYWVEADPQQFNRQVGPFVLDAHSSNYSLKEDDHRIVVIVGQTLRTTTSRPEVLRAISAVDELTKELLSIFNSLIEVPTDTSCSAISRPAFGYSNEVPVFYVCQTGENYGLRVYINESIDQTIPLEPAPNISQFAQQDQYLVYDVLPGWFITYSDGEKVYLASIQEPQQNAPSIVNQQIELELLTGAELQAWHNWKILYLDWAQFPVS